MPEQQQIYRPGLQRDCLWCLKISNEGSQVGEHNIFKYFKSHNMEDEVNRLEYIQRAELSHVDWNFK